MNRKSLISLALSAIFGGVVALLLFTTFIEEDKKSINTQNTPATLTNYVFDSTDFVVPEGLNFVFAAKSAKPSVVHIRTTYTGNAAANNPFNEFFEEYFGDRFRGRQNPSRGAGSGVIMTDDGYIVTNNHVVDGASEVKVLLNDNRTYDAEIVGTDPSTDLAVIKIDEKNLKSVKLGDSENLQIGEWVLAIGNPFEFRSTVTAGIVSAKGRNINILREQSRMNIEAFIQTDAAVNPGNSGGALVNLKGELVGINTAIASPTGAFAGYSFAVPATLVKKVVDDLVEYGVVQRALLGIMISDVNAQLAEEENLDLLKGVYVQEVNHGSAAQEAGMEKGDVIVAIDDKEVSNVAELQEQVALHRPGDRIKVRYIRDGEVIETKATLKNTNNTTSLVKVNDAFRSEGALFEEVSDELKEKLDIDGGVEAIQVESGRWKDAGLKEGFVVTKVDKQPILNMEDFAAQVNRARGDGMLIEGYYPNGEKAYYGIGW